MKSNSIQLEILGQPEYVKSWSVAGIPGFITSVLGRWQRNHGAMPERFVLIACPQVEINALGGLPDRVLELTNPRLRILHFTGCHKPYLVLLLVGDDAGARRETIQNLLSWSEGYEVECDDRIARLRFAEAIEEGADPIG